MYIGYVQRFFSLSRWKISRALPRDAERENKYVIYRAAPRFTVLVRRHGHVRPCVVSRSLGRPREENGSSAIVRLTPS